MKPFPACGEGLDDVECAEQVQQLAAAGIGQRLEQEIGFIHAGI